MIGGETVVLARDDTALFDLAVHEDAERFDLVRGAVRFIDRQFALVHAAAGSGRAIDRGIVLLGPASHNYYHWLLEHLTRFRTLESSPAHAGWPLLVDRAMVGVPQLAEALAALAGDRPLVVVDPLEAVRVGRLAIASAGAWLPLDLKNGLMLGPGDSDRGSCCNRVPP